jgi:hypothetical protein
MEIDFNDDISEITWNENDLKPIYYLYYFHKPIDTIFVYVSCYDMNNKYTLYKREENNIVKINDKIQKTDFNFTKTVTRIFFKNVIPTFFHKCPITSKNIFINYLNSQQTEYDLVKCSLHVYIKVDAKFLKLGKTFKNICWFKKKFRLINNTIDCCI